MKKLIIICFAVLALGTTAKAQTDVSINPFGLLFSTIGGSVEFGMSEDIGLEAGLYYDFGSLESLGFAWDNSGFGVSFIGKYYFNPTRGINKWNIGPYLSFSSSSQSSDFATYEVTSTRLSLGFYGGYKIVSAKNIVFEIGMGFGKALVNKSERDGVEIPEFIDFNIDVLGKLSVGYRFGGE